MAKRFLSIALHDMEPEVSLPVDIYLHVAGKFIRFKHREDVINEKKYNFLIYKKVNYIFIEAEHADILDAWIQQNRNNELESYVFIAGSENKELMQIKQQIKEKVIDLFAAEDVTNEKVSLLLNETRSLVQNVAKKPVADVSLVKLTNLPKSIVDHSLNVATLSLYLAHHLGFTQQKIMENVFLGGLFHDYGKTLMDPKYFEMDEKDIPLAEIHQHPKRGREALEKIPKFSAEVLRIIEEHHEHVDGTGFPNEKRAVSLYELSKIVSIANDFDQFVREAHGGNAEKLHQALSKLEKGGRTRYDADKLSKCLKALKLMSKGSNK